MLVVDLLHEFELGVWKDLFKHLLRIIEAADKALLDELDRRYAVQSLCSIICAKADALPLALGRYLPSVQIPSGVLPQIYPN